jgi:TRAP-type mannitol/chloroaromatic compound transport system substrate-binding protein
MATSWPKSLQILFESVDLFCHRVNKMTDGRFVITPYPAGELADGLKVMQAVEKGTVECGHTASYYYLDRGIALAFGTTIPFGLTASQQNAWLQYGGGLEAMQKLYAPMGIMSFLGGNTGTQMGGWFKREVQTSRDFKGLRIRVPGLGGKILEQLGAKIHSLPGNRIFEALEQNQVDAAEWKNPHADQMLGLHKVAPYYYYPGWWEPGTSYEFQVQRNEWEKLPKTYQAIFRAAAADMNEQMLAKFNAVNGDVLGQLKQGGTQVLPFSQEILKSSYKIAFELYEEYASKDQIFREIYEKWKQFRNQIYSWNELNELGYIQFYLRNSKA